jgi:hypothetical protein
LGPFTLTCWPSTLMVTPLGTDIGLFPIRDIYIFSFTAAAAFSQSAGNRKQVAMQSGVGRSYHT